MEAWHKKYSSHQGWISALGIAEVLQFFLAVVFVYRNSSINAYLKTQLPGEAYGLVGLYVVVVLVSYLLLGFNLFIGKKLFRGKLTNFLLLQYCFILATTTLLTLIQSQSYENFIFGKLGIFLPYLQLIALLTIPKLTVLYLKNNYLEGPHLINLKGTKVMTLVQDYLERSGMNTLLRSPAIFLPSVLIGGMLAYAAAMNAFAFPVWGFQETELFITNLSLNPEERYEKGLVRLHKYVKFVADHTPTDAVIIHPMQSDKFPIVGNQVLIRYYLYPRLLISHARIEQFKQANLDPQVVYAIAIRGLPENQNLIFPTAPINAESVTLLLEDESVVTFENTNVSEEWLASFNNFQVGVIKYSL